MLNESLFDVVTKATTRDLTTVETAREELEIEGSAQDNRLARWIRETSGDIEKWCNRVFALETVSETWRMSDRWRPHWNPPDTSTPPEPLLLRRHPVVEIVSITEDDTTVLTPDLYECATNTGKVWRLIGGIRVHWYATRIAVVYSAGFDVPRAVPPPLEEACLALLKIRNDTNGRDRMLRTQVIPGVLEEQYWNPSTPGQPGMPPEIAEKLTPFRDYNA